MHPCLQIINRNAGKKEQRDWERYLLFLKLEGNIECERYARKNYSRAVRCVFFNILTFPFQKEMGS